MPLVPCYGKETFSDNHVAEIMNKHFISIKVDREEQPAVDHVYMDFYWRLKVMEVGH